MAAALEQLKIEYIEQSRAFQLAEKAEGWQLASDPAYAPWVRQLFPAVETGAAHSAFLETLAIIAYRQPITRADVEAVRGVAIDGVLQTLMERGLVKIAGRAEVPGRPSALRDDAIFPRAFRPARSRRTSKRRGIANAATFPQLHRDPSPSAEAAAARAERFRVDRAQRRRKIDLRLSLTTLRPSPLSLLYEQTRSRIWNDFDPPGAALRNSPVAERIIGWSRWSRT